MTCVQRVSSKNKNKNRESGRSKVARRSFVILYAYYSTSNTKLVIIIRRTCVYIIIMMSIIILRTQIQFGQTDSVSRATVREINAIASFCYYCCCRCASLPHIFFSDRSLAHGCTSIVIFSLRLGYAKIV